MQKMRQVYRNYGWTELAIIKLWYENNTKKTKVMKVSKLKGEVNITINGTRIEQVGSFRYLGHTMTEDGRSTVLYVKQK